MNIFKSLKSHFLVGYSSQENNKYLFEFGNVKYEDRLMAAAKIRSYGQGELLNSGNILDLGSAVIEGMPSNINVAKAAFRSIKELFENSDLKDSLEPWSVIGFMSNSLDPNGLADVVRSENTSVQYINVTAGAYLHTLYSAYHIIADPRFEPSLPQPGEFFEVKVGNLFNTPVRIPKASKRHELAHRFANAALKTTFFHEIAHILRGHVVYMNNSSLSGVQEVTSALKASNSISTLDIDLKRRALETDADDFSGRFMALHLFKDFTTTKRTFDDKSFRDRAFEVLVGLVLMYSWFLESEGYHSGSLRIYVVLGAMFTELGLDKKIAAKWTSERVDAVQDLIIKGGLMRSSSTLSISKNKLIELNEITLAYRESNMREWLQYRPWDNKDKVGNQNCPSL
jgi:hypothetical protein